MEQRPKADIVFLQKLHRKTWKTVCEYGLIEEGDRILIGLSGGKDSLALAEMLGERSKIYTPRFSVIAAHVGMMNIPYKTDLTYLQDFCSKLAIPFVYEETCFDLATDTRKSPCFLCSWNRRKKLFDIAKAQNCNKIALGHHMDDMVETLLMNLTFQGAIGTMPPLLQMEKFDMCIIRPLAQIPESDLVHMAMIQGYHKQEKICPYEKKSFRADMKKIVHKLEELNPTVRQTMWSAMENVQYDYLPKKQIKK